MLFSFYFHYPYYHYYYCNYFFFQIPPMEMFPGFPTPTQDMISQTSWGTRTCPCPRTTPPHPPRGTPPPPGGSYARLSSKILRCCDLRILKSVILNIYQRSHRSIDPSNTCYERSMLFFLNNRMHWISSSGHFLEKNPWMCDQLTSNGGFSENYDFTAESIVASIKSTQY